MSNLRTLTPENLVGLKITSKRGRNDYIIDTIEKRQAGSRVYTYFRLVSLSKSERLHRMPFMYSKTDIYNHFRAYKGHNPYE